MSSLAELATRWADGAWDEGRGLLWNPPGSFEDYALPARSMHMVPQSAWYAIGLLARGDTARAERIFRELCALQYDHPGVAWHGTFARFAEWPQPPEQGAVEWQDYDPNWRQFLGTTFAVALREFDLTASVAEELQGAIDLVVASEPPDRVSPSYSNIALMRAWLEGDEQFAAAIVDRFDQHGAFDEYNSPTYYGVDLFALALWCRYPPTAQFAAWGERLWSSLWRDIQRWWHPGLGNLCGPYSRAYGMDLSAYVGLVGLWMPEPVTPALDAPFDHSHDLTMAPVVAVVLDGLRRPDVTVSVDERVVEQPLGDDRAATGWLAPGVMIGGERGARFRADGQYHPATAHWSLPDGSVGWLRLRHDGPLWATAAPGTLTIEVRDHPRRGRRPVIVEASHPAVFGSDRWSLPGRTIRYNGPVSNEDGIIDAGAGDELVLEIT